VRAVFVASAAAMRDWKRVMRSGFVYVVLVIRIDVTSGRLDVMAFTRAV
jgi:hypothetical protein